MQSQLSNSDNSEEEEFESVFILEKMIEDLEVNPEIRKILIMKLIEGFYQENIKNKGQYTSYEPTQIFFIGNLKNPNHLTMTLNPKASQKHLFMAPEELNYQKVS